MLVDLPQEVLLHVLFSTPPRDLILRASLANKKLHNLQDNVEFWKEYCAFRYPVYKGASLFSSLKQHALHLENGVRWDAHHTPLRISNAGYTLECTSQTKTQFNAALGDKYFQQGKFYQKYFEIFVDNLPQSAEVPQIMVGVAPNDVLSQDISKVCTYLNTGVANGQTRGFSSFGTGDRIGVLLNFEYMTVSFLKNDVLQGTPYVYLSKTFKWHPVVVLMVPGAKVSLVLPPRMTPPQMPLGM